MPRASPRTSSAVRTLRYQTRTNSTKHTVATRCQTSSIGKHLEPRRWSDDIIYFNVRTRAAARTSRATCNCSTTKMAIWRYKSTHHKSSRRIRIKDQHFNQTIIKTVKNGQTITCWMARRMPRGFRRFRTGHLHRPRAASFHKPQERRRSASFLQTCKIPKLAPRPARQTR